MIISVFLNSLYLLFPIFCYIFYIVYTKVSSKEEKSIFFDLALFSSFFICARFGTFNLLATVLINIPLVLAFYKKRVLTTFLLCFSISLYLFLNLGYSIIFLEYILIYIAFLSFKSNRMCSFVIIKIIFGIIMFLLNKFEFNNFIIMLALFGFMIVLYYFTIIFSAKIEDIVRMFYSLNELTKEKKLYESLFKITHEIKNPIAVCKGYLDMFNIKDEKKANKYINIINQEIDRTLLLLNDFSNVSKMKVEKSLIDINMLIEDVCDEIDLMFDDKIRFKYNVSDDEIYINGDYNRLKQVFINVIKNAKESIKDKGQVFLDIKIKKDKYYIYVKDDGIGMDKQTLESIGTAFYTTKKDGTGLGVCLSKEIINKHNGSIKYFSNEKKGTTVQICLPILRK